MLAEAAEKKLCRGRCGQVRPLADFAVHKRDGRYSRCQECRKADKKDAYDADPAKHIGWTRRWQQDHPVQHSLHSRRYAAKTRGWVLGEKRCACGAPIPDIRRKCDACKAGHA